MAEGVATELSSHGKEGTLKSKDNGCLFLCPPVPLLIEKATELALPECAQLGMNHGSMALWINTFLSGITPGLSLSTDQKRTVSPLTPSGDDKS